MNVRSSERFRGWEYLLFAAAAVLTLLLSVCVGSVRIPLRTTATVIWNGIWGLPQPAGTAPAILLTSRLPRVLAVMLVGASLSLCGGAMQGLLKNPLADGSTLGVSSGASLGAVIAIAFGITIPNLPFAGTMVMAMVFAFCSLLIILGLAYRLDFSLSTNTIILIGVIFSMFASSVMSIIITFSGEKLHSITFWTMGSLQGSSYTNVLVLLCALIAFGGVILLHDVRRVKLVILIAVSGLIGVSVSIGGTIGFVGLVTPHMVRLLVGPNHKRLLPASLFGGGIFLMLSDLIARTLLNPKELPIGVVTSIIGAVAFVYIYGSSRKGR